MPYILLTMPRLAYLNHIGASSLTNREYEGLIRDCWALVGFIGLGRPLHLNPYGPGAGSSTSADRGALGGGSDISLEGPHPGLPKVLKLGNIHKNNVDMDSDMDTDVGIDVEIQLR